MSRKIKEITMKEIELKLTEQELNFIFNAVQELPARIANPLMKKIQEQAIPQVQQQAQ